MHLSAFWLVVCVRTYEHEKQYLRIIKPEPFASWLITQQILCCNVCCLKNFNILQRWESFHFISTCFALSFDAVIKNKSSRTQLLNRSFSLIWHEQFCDISQEITNYKEVQSEVFFYDPIKVFNNFSLSWLIRLKRVCFFSLHEIKLRSLPRNKKPLGCCYLVFRFTQQKLFS